MDVHTSFVVHLETLRENDALPSFSKCAKIEQVLDLEERHLWDLAEEVRRLKGIKRDEALRNFNLLHEELLSEIELEKAKSDQNQ